MQGFASQYKESSNSSQWKESPTLGRWPSGNVQTINKTTITSSIVTI